MMIILLILLIVCAGIVLMGAGACLLVEITRHAPAELRDPFARKRGEERDA